MALRSLSRTPSATSGPGRGPASDGRMSHREARGRARRRRASARAEAGAGAEAGAESVRLRAERLFVEPGSPRLGVAAADAVLVHDEVGVEGPAPATHPDADADADADPDAGAAVQPELPSRRERVGLAVRDRLPLWLHTRCGLERRGVTALAVVLLVAAVFAAQHFWTGRAQPVRPPDVVREAGSAAERGAEPAPSPGPSARAGEQGDPVGAAAGGGAATKIVVDVSGKVRHPGVCRLPAGSRVADALRAAGGVRPGTETDGLNRARFLVDGEQVVVGGPATAAGVGGGGAGAGAGSAGVAGGAGGAAVAGGAGGAPATGPIGLNTATAEQLDELPGVGPVLAQHILDYRAEHGGFRSVEELREVNGIGDRRFADLQDLVRP
ncbi:ComEA family DNA-binding protein [Streptomyces sp. NPDC046465]|uniref:ComEA family DNA-binding protein n=1 Tax=Streptomyces sp. NPDC046465 TaxID=3155810 RepID=UPI0033F5BAE1